MFAKFAMRPRHGSIFTSRTVSYCVPYDGNHSALLVVEKWLQNVAFSYAQSDPERRRFNPRCLHNVQSLKLFPLRPLLPQLSMDQIFAHVTDHIALSGRDGILLNSALSFVVGFNPRPQLLTFLAKQFASHPDKFFPKVDHVPAAQLHIVAHEKLRWRALGYSPLEHPPLQDHALNILERVGMAGADGILQSELGPLVGLAANMVHHYIGSLSARRLVARRKVVLTKHRVARMTSPDVHVTHLKPAENIYAASANDTPATSVTLTAVIVLARFAGSIKSSNASKPVVSLPNTPGTDVRGGGANAQGGYPSTVEGEPVIDNTMHTRMERVLEALRVSPHVRAEKDLKVIAVPNSDHRQTVSWELFQKRRHRAYRALRNKLVRSGMVVLTQKECVSRTGKRIGQYACLKLSEMGMKKFVEGGEVFDSVEHEMEEGSKMLHPMLKDGGRPRFLAEVDLVEQVYQLLLQAGTEGISVPELATYLDDSTGLTGALPKRVRSIVTAISKTDPTVETQRFEGSAMYLRIVLKRFLETPAVSGVADGGQEAVKLEDIRMGDKDPRRRKIGLTALGEQRQKIVLDILRERMVVVMETLGREVAKVEQTGLHRVDPKVMKRLISDLVIQKRIKIITTMKPAIKENRRSQTIVLVALPDVDERSAEVRSIVSFYVNRTLYGQPDEGKDGEGKKSTGPVATMDGVAKRIDFDESDGHADLSGGKKVVRKRARVELPADSRDIAGEGEPPVVVDHADTPDVVDESADGEGSDKEWRGAARTGSSRLRKRKRRGASIDEKSSKSKSRKGKRGEHNGSGESVEGSKRKKGRLENGKKNKNKSNEKKATEKTDNQTAILLQSQTRDWKAARVSRLRAIDYGWLKGKLARVRKFHKELYAITQGVSESEAENPPTVVHSTVEATMNSPTLGRFTMSECLRTMTVKGYAATVGIHRDYGNTIQNIEDDKIENVLNILGDELTSLHGSRQTLNIVQTLSKLGLIESDADSYWMLRGGGVIRDFGKGLPTGVIPHGIVFSCMSSVEAYWMELEQFARCKMSRRPAKKEKSSASDTIAGASQAADQRDRDPKNVNDVYFPMRWETGVQRLLKSEQLMYETSLQRLSGVELLMDLPNRLHTSNFMEAPLQWFTIDELDAEFERILSVAKKGTRSQKHDPTPEKLLLYSRFRSKNPIPTWIREHEESMKDSLEEGGKVRNLNRDQSCQLQLKRTASQVNGLQMRGAYDTSHTRNSKKLKKFTGAKKLPPETQVGIVQLFPFFRALIARRASAYFKDDAQGLEWKNVAGMMRYELGKLQQQNPKDGKKSEESILRAVVALCDSSVVRASLDILSLKVALRLQETKGQVLGCQSWDPEGCNLLQHASMLLAEWEGIDAIVEAVILEVRDSVRPHARLTLLDNPWSKLSATSVRVSLLERECSAIGLRHGRQDRLAHMIAVMATRFRMISDLRLRANLRHGLLFFDASDGSVPAVGRVHSSTGSGLGNGKASNDEGVAVPIPDRGNGCSDAQNALPHIQANRRSSNNLHEVKNLGESGDANRNNTDRDNDERQENANAIDMAKVGTEKACDSAPEQLRYLNDAARAQTNSKRVGKPQQSPTNEPYYKAMTIPALPESAKKNYCQAVVEMLVSIITRQSCHLQQTPSIAGLLRDIPNVQISKARDELILRGSILPTDTSSNCPCFMPAKNESPHDTLEFISKGDTSREDEWLREISGLNGVEGCFETTKVWADVCRLDNPDISTTAASVVTRAVIYGGLSLLPSLAKPMGGSERMRLEFRYEQRGEGASNTCVPDGSSEGCKEMKKRIETLVSTAGAEGLALDEILRDIRPRCDKERETVAHALFKLLSDGDLCRFAVETGSTEWDMGASVRYICRIHAAPFLTHSQTDSSSQALTYFHTPSGIIDAELLQSVDATLRHMLSRSPGMHLDKVVSSLSGRFTTIARQAAADVVWACEHVSRDVSEWDAELFGGGWKCVEELEWMTGFVDGIAIWKWGRGRVCVGVRMSGGQGRLKEFDLFEKEWWR